MQPCSADIVYPRHACPVVVCSPATEPPPYSAPAPMCLQVLDVSTPGWDRNAQQVQLAKPDVHLLARMASLRLLCVGAREGRALASSSTGDDTSDARGKRSNAHVLVLCEALLPNIFFWNESGVRSGLEGLLPHGWDGGMDAAVWEQIHSARVRGAERLLRSLEEPVAENEEPVAEKA